MPTITGFHQDEDGRWIAELACGHQRHVHHLPPFQNREWVETEAGRARHLGAELPCGLCDQGIPANGDSA